MKVAKHLSICVIVSWIFGWFFIPSKADSNPDVRPPEPAFKIVLLTIPVLISAVVSNGSHQPSAVGFWIGFFIQWTAIGILLFVPAGGLACFQRASTLDEPKA